MQYYEKIKNAVREADRVLVGLGEEWVLTDEVIYNAVEDSHPVFTALLKFAATQEQYRDIVPYLEAFYYNQITEIPDMWKDAYAHLRRLLEGKDYYIVSLTIDPYLSQMGFDMDRCVNPCGSVQRMQCRNGCTEELYIAKSIMQVFSEKLQQKMQEFRIGVLRVEDVDEASGKIILTVSEADAAMYQQKEMHQSSTAL